MDNTKIPNNLDNPALFKKCCKEVKRVFDCDNVKGFYLALAIESYYIDLKKSRNGKG